MKKLLLTLLILFTTISVVAWAGVDPTMPPGAQGANGGAHIVDGFSVSSIMLGAKRKLAYINNQAVTIGDMLDNARIVEINSNDVILTRGGKKIIVPVIKDIKGRK